jgi:aspartyl-tRNA(Asn)/glutamyl-tRNA(Gln) amidotransferase subunit A
MARYDGFRYGLRGPGQEWTTSTGYSRGAGFGREVKRRILTGAYALSAGYKDAYYLKAAKVRRVIANDFNEALQKCDAVLMPVTPVIPPKFGESFVDPLTAYLADLFTIPANLTGLPALAFPVGKAGGMPVGAQLIGRSCEEAALYKFAYAYETRVAPFHFKKDKSA